MPRGSGQARRAQDDESSEGSSRCNQAAAKRQGQAVGLCLCAYRGHDANRMQLDGMEPGSVPEIIQLFLEFRSRRVGAAWRNPLSLKAHRTDSVTTVFLKPLIDSSPGSGSQERNSCKARHRWQNQNACFVAGQLWHALSGQVQATIDRLRGGQRRPLIGEASRRRGFVAAIEAGRPVVSLLLQYSGDGQRATARAWVLPRKKGCQESPCCHEGRFR
jgi:hypothetical protein